MKKILATTGVLVVIGLLLTGGAASVPLQAVPNCSATRVTNCRWIINKSGRPVPNTINTAAMSSVLTINNTATGSDITGLTVSGEDIGLWGQTSGDVGSIGVVGINSGTGVVGNGWDVGVVGYSDYGTGVRASSLYGTPLVIWGYNGANLIQAYDTELFPSNLLRFKVERDGDVYADRGFHCGLSVNDSNASGDLSESEIDACLSDDTPADFAEMVAAGPGLAVPGDVLVIGRDGLVGPSTDPYQSSVVGVYSTRPSYLGNASQLGVEGFVPLAITGIVPVKVSAENGAIQPGDLLTTSTLPGYAMLASPVTIDGISFYLPGTILGKALEPLEGGTGVILVLVTLQ